MSVELTKISADEYSRILSGEMTPAMAAEYLRGEHIVPRDFGGILRNLYPADDIQFRLTAAFTADGESEASASRKVFNWLTGKNRPTARTEAACTEVSRLTHKLRSDFLLVQNTDQLRACYLANLENFGLLHMRAFHYFDRYMAQLIHPSSSLADTQEKDYSLDAVMELYVYYNTVAKNSQYNFEH